MTETRHSHPGKVLWHTSMSLDGFIAGPDDDVAWVFDHMEPSVTAPDIVERTGAMLTGRRSYDVGRRDADKVNGEPHAGGWNGPVFVLTHNPPEDDTETTFVNGPLDEVVTKALTAGQPKDLILVGADLARQCLQAGLVDEMIVHVAPVLLGAGTPLYRDQDRFGGLELTAVEQSGPVATLRYQLN